MGATDVVPTEQMHQWTSAFTGINTKAPVIRFTSPRADAQDPAAIAKWIEANVPCFDGPVSTEWEDAVWSAISREFPYIQPVVLDAVFTLLKKDGYIFQGGGRGLASSQDRGPPRNPAPIMSPVDEDYVRQSLKAMLEQEEAQYEIAVLNHDVKAMNKIARRVADALNSDPSRTLEEREWQHGAPLLRRAIVRPRGAPEGGRGGAGGGPYRVSPELEITLPEPEFEVD